MLPRERLDELQERRILTISPFVEPNHDVESYWRWMRSTGEEAEWVRATSESFLQAGADLLRTASLFASRCALLENQVAVDTYGLNKAAASVARHIVDRWNQASPERPAFVLGVVASMFRWVGIGCSPDMPEKRNIEFDPLVDDFRVQLDGLRDGGADLIEAAMVYDLLTLKALLVARQSSAARDLPLMVSFTLSDCTGRLISGHTLEAAYSALSSADVYSFGVDAVACMDSIVDAAIGLSRLCHAMFHYTLTVAYPQSPIISHREIQQQIARFSEDGLINSAGTNVGGNAATTSLVSEIARRHAPQRRRVSAPFAPPRKVFKPRLAGLLVARPAQDLTKPDECRPESVI
ncbi:MAG: homocysteine S-methyltransferase family protein [Planctomycetota bacterium]